MKHRSTLYDFAAAAAAAAADRRSSCCNWLYLCKRRYIYILFNIHTHTRMHAHCSSIDGWILVCIRGRFECGGCVLSSPWSRSRVQSNDAHRNLDNEPSTSTRDTQSVMHDHTASSHASKPVPVRLERSCERQPTTRATEIEPNNVRWTRAEFGGNAGNNSDRRPMIYSIECI